MSKQIKAKNNQFLELYSHHEPLVRAYVRSGIYNSHDVADIMQKVSIVAWNKFHDLKDPEIGFGKWMCVIARYEIMRFRRDKKRDKHVLTDNVVNKILTQGVEEYESRMETIELMQECIQSLKTGEKKLIEVAYNSKTSIKAFALSINKPAQALYQQLNRIRTKLANCLELKFKEQNI